MSKNLYRPGSLISGAVLFSIIMNQVPLGTVIFHFVRLFKITFAFLIFLMLVVTLLIQTVRISVFYLSSKSVSF